MRDRLLPILILSISAVLTLILAVSIDPLAPAHPAFSKGGDHLRYIEMYQSTFTPQAAPYAYRVLTPALAKLLPFSMPTSFRIITALSIVTSALLVFLIVDLIVGSKLIAFSGLILFYSLSAGPKFLVYDFWLTEPLLFMSSTLALLLILRSDNEKRDIWNDISLIIVISLAVLTKESALFLLPLVYSLRAKSLFDVTAANRAVVIAILPLAIFVILHLVVHSDQVYSPIAQFKTIGLQRLTSGLGGFVRGGTVGTWGVLIPVLCVLSGRKGFSFALRGVPFLLLVYLQPLFANNLDRLLVYGFLIVLPVAAIGLQRIANRFQLDPWMVLGLVIVPFVLTALKDDYQSPSPEQRLLFLAIWIIIVIVAKYIAHRRVLPGTTN